MKNILKKIHLFSFLLIISFTFAGCNDFNLFQKPDPLLTNIHTKEEVLDFLIDTSKSWNIVKAKVNVSFITLPLEGHIDITNEIAYIETYKYVDKVKHITKYYYLLEDNIYECEISDENNTYRQTQIIGEIGIEFKLNDLLSMFKKENFDLEQLTHEINEYQISLSFKHTDDSGTYNTKITYKNKTIKIVIDNKATLTLTKGHPNFFENLDIDLSLFE